MNEAPEQPDQSGRRPTEGEAPVARRALPPFSPQRLRRRLAVDAAMRYAVIAIVVLGVAIVWGFDDLSPMVTVLLVVGVVAAWVLAGVVNGRVMQQFDRVLMLIERDPAEAEDLLARLMDQRGLMRWVRLVLYQRMAMLRHRAERFDESAAIARAMLSYPLGPAEPARANLLLLLVEADLKRADVHGAYAALAQLAAMNLPILERVQRMALQTRYEVMLGADARALYDLDRKIALAELMPPAQCGAWHANVAVAAGRAQRGDLADWLRRRAQLLCDPAQWEQLQVASVPSEQAPWD